MGVCRAGRADGQTLCVGRLFPASRRVDGEYAPGPFPRSRLARGRPWRHREGRFVSCERLWAVRCGRQCLGMDERLVSARLLCGARPLGRRARPARPRHVLRSRRTGDPEARASRRVVPVHGAVLLALHGGDAGQGGAFDGNESPLCSSSGLRPAPTRRSSRPADSRWFASICRLGWSSAVGPGAWSPT